MRRRQFIAGLGATAAWPLAVRAQQGERVRRIGVLMNAPATDRESQSYLAAFSQGLRQLGWTEDQNLRTDVRWNAADAGLARTYAAQLIGLMPDVILRPDRSTRPGSSGGLVLVQLLHSTEPRATASPSRSALSPRQG
jgi:putative tryptophan/tyrosine transport system substrate-binding protein